jgi:uncharacterized protein YukE
VATYSVDIASMEDAQTDLGIIYSNLRSSLDHLDTAKAAFESANAGLAVAGYSEAQAHWNAAMSDFHEAVQSAGVAVGQISENYQHVDIRGQKMFSA